jgi:hypothetical protein
MDNNNNDEKAKITHPVNISMANKAIAEYWARVVSIKETIATVENIVTTTWKETINLVRNNFDNHLGMEDVLKNSIFVRFAVVNTFTDAIMM